MRRALHTSRVRRRQFADQSRTTGTRIDSVNPVLQVLCLEVTWQATVPVESVRLTLMELQTNLELTEGATTTFKIYGRIPECSVQ